ETPPVETKPPVAVAPPVETPTVETKPPVAVAPPVETPPVETSPPVETKPPVAVAPPIETTPPVTTLPVATTPPVATLPTPPTPPVQPPTIAPEPPLVELPPIDDMSQPIDPEPPVEPDLPISSPPENRAFIGIIDTGFATNNPDLDYSKVTLGRDRIDKDSNPLFTAGTGNEHGTFSWGLVSAIQGNDRGIDGYNDKANIYLSRAIGSGEWDLALTDFVGEAKAQKKKNVIALLPLDLTQKNADGSITTRYEFTPRERAALENARQNGVLLVVAAGNDGGVMSVLGQSSQEFENILTVGSSDGFGRSDYSSYGYGLDILVPGGAIDNPTLSTVGDDLGTMAGTSASAAKAAGMASKVWESNPDLNATQVIDILTGSAIDLKEPGWDKETGFGVVNLNKAVQMAKETAPQSYTPSPFITPITWDGEGKVTPMERATQDWNAVGDGRRKYVGWLNSSNTSDKLSFTVTQTIPLFQFSVNFLEGSATLYDSNGNTIASAAPTSNILYGTANLAPGNYYVLVDKGSRSAIDPYEAVLNFTGLSGEVKPLDDTILLPRPTLTPSPTPIQIVGEIGKEYLKIGGESRMGKPLQNQVEQANGFIKQLFEKGSMIWNGSKVATVDFGGVKAFESFVKDVSSPPSIPSANVDISKNWKAEVYKWDRGSELQPPGKLSEATPTSKFLGSFDLGSNSKKELKFDWGNGSPAGNSKFPADNFVIKTYTDTDFQANKTYKFSARGDDGFRLFARPLDKPDAWELITPITDTSINPDTRSWWQEYYSTPKEYEFKPKEGGTYRVVALFYDRDSSANFDLSWNEVPPPVSSGNYYPNIETVLDNFLSKPANTKGEKGWAQKTIDDKWDRIGGESAQYGQYESPNFSGGDNWQIDMPSDVQKVYADLSTSIFGSPKVVTTGYAFDRGYYSSKGAHSGIDIGATKGTDVKAAVRGIVVTTEFHSGNGSWIAIDELDKSGNKTGRRWWYGHLSETINVKKGDTVIAGKTKLASTNNLNHLHLSVLNINQSVGDWNDIINGKKLALTEKNYVQNVQNVLSRTISPLEAYWKSRNGMKD
ncbi:S8 family serine peptidase, partial [Microcoleus sp. Pol17_C1]|uniref:S8 family serine peptidase n=1 Tax=unclassified Microcoleus TaxID=2642155 RepID=UPI002FD0E23A